MDNIKAALNLINMARQILAMPTLYETINNVRFYVNYEKSCSHNEAHVHVEEGGIEAVFSLVNGRKMRGSIPSENDVLAFLRNISNRRRLLRRYKNWQSKGKCSYLVAPVNTGNMQDKHSK